MADPTLTLTFSDYILRVAEYLGVAFYGANGDQAAQVPTDVHDLDLCKRIVNDGYRRFLGESPLWRFLTVPVDLTFKQRFTGSVTATSDTSANNGNVALSGITMTDTGKIGSGANAFVGFNIYLNHNTVSPQVQGSILGVDIYNVTAYNDATGVFTLTRLNIGGGTSSLITIVVNDSYEMADPACVHGQNFRYYLPDDFSGSLAMPFTYGVGGPRIAINPVDEHRIRELRVGANTSGTASVVAIRAINTDDTSTGKRWEAMFWPIPTGLNRVTAAYRRYPAAFTNLTDRSVAGFMHDNTILAAAIAEAELQRNDTQPGPREQNYQAALLRSRKIDARASADKVSDYGDRSEDRAVGGRRPLNYYSVSTYNGSNIGDLT